MPIELATADPKECWAKCNATKECAAWAYAVPGCDRWTKPQCWLKGDSHHGDTKNSCRVSGTQGVPSGRVAKPVLAPIKSTTDAGGYTVTAAERPSGVEEAPAKRRKKSKKGF